MLIYKQRNKSPRYDEQRELPQAEKADRRREKIGIPPVHAFVVLNLINELNVRVEPCGQCPHPVLCVSQGAG